MSKLEKLIPQYAQDKLLLDTYKKTCDAENAEIKQLMLEENKTTFEAEGYVANRIVSVRETMNEAALLAIAHHYGISEIVKTKEYIDFDALEDAIYNGRISKDILIEIGKARESKEVVSLKISKVKSKKGDK